jgi:hypothetical protein
MTRHRFQSHIAHHPPLPQIIEGELIDDCNMSYYSDAKARWTGDHETVVQLYSYLPEEMKFSKYLKCFVLIGGWHLFEDQNIHKFARDRNRKFERAIDTCTHDTPIFSKDLYSRLQPNPIIETLYAKACDSTLQLRIRTNNKSPSRTRAKSSKSSEESVDASFTNEDNALSNGMNQLALSAPNKTKRLTCKYNFEAFLLKLYTADNPQRMRVMLNAGRTSANGNRSYQTLAMFVPMENTADVDYYSMRLSQSPQDFNNDGITALEFTYPIGSSADVNQMYLYLDAVQGDIDDFNEGNKLVTNEAKVADEQNRKWAFTKAFNNDMFDHDGTLKVKTKTMYGGQLAVEVGTEWQGETYDSEPHNEFLLKKTFAPIATTEIVYDVESLNVNTHLYWEMA